MYTRFNASQSVEIAVPDERVPIQHYLRQPRRLVNALVDRTRTEQLSDDCFRLKMRPLQFMMLSIQPTVDMRVWAQSEGAINLESVACSILGVDYINDRFALNLKGKLYVHQNSGVAYLKGKADLEVQVELPPPFWLTPKPILEATGNGLLKSVLLSVKQRLMYQLLLDYRRWASSETEVISSDIPQILSVEG
ncbi:MULTISPECIES: DUF1997 domain-containing protein [unclassified Microcoleus]|jgi:hypothetical protein|uniref:DUF1997 domain-containing protein n=1 Tax=unclassified Microcoleus TaxID=2642155 RepID=UPI001DE7570D|nr:MULTISPECIES: DUF1997 domain-containing protein [unclassified Microcoleus]MCC3468149.1 DUF1997 domain-containing protein [Microcoleus sp. PH2017_06_SFM_O_A]MCC3512434.1 DUF1997 domain-containing protein [Microcoleus sp. PH2017_17_BER_D_A]TAE06675.1 MAG: DUF1997 domain-containing protein [Oscillatoriales cyanobacterium]MCC3415036.1 DUF1997 domain-containing protein [Microcoleus sp. PH2017_02_FOX_O_A]MCC3435007.1 DUF1997 domain-containing protein [Microcoleus sp. PH2017_05_CCC_O_A]